MTTTSSSIYIGDLVWVYENFGNTQNDFSYYNVNKNAEEDLGSEDTPENERDDDEDYDEGDYVISGDR
jgi:hypothetical protein